MHQRSEEGGNEIAIVGMAGRFPGANDLDTFWANLRDGVESVSEVSLEEWSESSGLYPSLLERPAFVKARPRIEGADVFDADFFGFTPRDARILDPQQRLFLEVAWAALEDAGYDSERYRGSIGVAAGISQSSYLMSFLQWDAELNRSAGGLQVGLGNMNDSVATRVAYKLDLKGAAYAVQSFCSTSLVAVHLGCQSLLSHESDMALAGGVTIGLPQEAGYVYQEGGILSPDGHTRTFDARGRGTVFGNGLGIVVLKRLRDALADGDNVRAVILGTAINNDGAMKVGFTAPSVSGQAEVIVEALSAADVDPATIGYVEAHGTATALGDPAEIAGLTRAWRRWTDEKQYCAIGSVKTNVGHLDAAAGVAGLMKTVLALENGQIPPSLHYEEPNPQIDFESTPFYVNTKLRDWSSEKGPRRAGVSAFGIGGTNAHMILQEAPPRSRESEAQPWQLLTLSAKTPTALDRATENLARHLSAKPELSLGDVAFTLQAGRRVFNHRRVVVCRDTASAPAALRDPGRRTDGVGERRSTPVAFLLTGQGSQYPGMGQGLYEGERVFRESLDRCSALLREPLGLDLADLLYRSPDASAAAEQLRETRLTQPSLFAVEYALAQLWRSWGVEPTAMIGHSIGELVAAHLAGVFSLEDAVALVAERGRLMQAAPEGAMLAVSLGEEALRGHLDAELDLATVNGPSACVAAGPVPAVERLERELSERGITARRLRTSHAFHSASMDGVVDAFVAEVAKRKLAPPNLRFVSNVTGTWIESDQATDPAYWGRHLREAVRFSDGLSCLRAEGDPALLEVGPGNTLASLARQNAGAGGSAAVATSLRHPNVDRDDRAVLLEALGRLWTAGVDVDWAAAHGDEEPRRIPLPTYPFEGKRFFSKERAEHKELRTVAMGASKRRDVGDWFYQPTWRRLLPAELAGPLRLQDASRWLVFDDGLGLGEAVVQRLAEVGGEATLVRPGAAFAHDGARIEIDPRDPAHYQRLVEVLVEEGGFPARVVHAWGVTGSTPRAASLEERLERCQDLGFYSLLFLTQALVRAEVQDPLEVAVVTDHARDVVGGDLTQPEKATAFGPCKVIPQEYKNVVVHSVDVEAGGPLSQSTIAGWIIGELVTRQQDFVKAYRGRHRWVESLEPTPLADAPGDGVLRERGTYLITGGLGGIGLVLARHLAESCRARLVLTGRSAMPEEAGWEAWLEAHPADDATSRRIRQLRELAALGAEVTYLAADASREADLEAALAAAEERFGPLHGIVHAAGVPGGGIIPLKERAAAERVMAPKVQGTLFLERLLDGRKLDWVALCSSTAAILGGFGQIDYCGANAFLDAVARRPRSEGATRYLSINWDTWREIGMAVNVPVSGALQARRQVDLMLGIAPAEGVDAFRRALVSEFPHLVVLTRDARPALVRRIVQGNVRRKTTQEPEAGTSAPAPEAVEAKAAAAPTLEQTICAAWAEVLGREEIAPADNFFELGGDSLGALQAIAILKRKLNREIPVVLFYDAPTVAALAKALADEERTEEPGTARKETDRRAQTRLERMQRRRRQRSSAAALDS